MPYVAALYTYDFLFFQQITTRSVAVQADDTKVRDRWLLVMLIKNNQ